MKAQTGEKPGRLGLPEDWSHRHVVFGGATPGSHEVARAVVHDPRFWHQQFRRAARPEPRKAEHPRRKKHRVDWSVNLGGAGSRLAAGTFPAKYTFDVNASPSCTSDFAVFALDIAGSASQATIVAYNNLYTGTPSGLCAGTAPTVLWAYNTGGAINTSPVLSLDGKKVAWVAGVGAPVLHVLTIGTGVGNGTTVDSPAVPGAGNNASDAQVSFGTLGDTRSSLFVDYSNDVGYVASDDGDIHKFTGIFHGTPAEVTSGGWPMHGQDAGSHVLTSVVYDSVSKNLFYGSDAGTFAYIRESGSTRGACVTLGGLPPCLGLNSYSLSGAIVDAPVVDPIAQTVFAFVGNNGSLHAAVQQADTQLSTHGPQANIGTNGSAIFAGAFDNNYYSNASSGFLYVCGYASGAATPTLYQIGFNTSNVMSTTPSVSTVQLSTATATCSPMTEIFNPPTLKDWLFVSVVNGCPAALGAGTGGCVESLDVTAGFPSGVNTARAAAGGTSGIVVDNVSTSGQASSIYFSSQADSVCGDGTTSGCAVKMTQSGLQ